MRKALAGTASQTSIVQLDHVAVASPKISGCYNFLLRAGATPRKGGEELHFRGGQWSFADGSVLEILEPKPPLNAENFLWRFLQPRDGSKETSRLHHVTFLVPSVRDYASRASELGFSVVGLSERKPHWKEAFLHPKEALGIVVQMAEYDPAVNDGMMWTEDWPDFRDYEQLRSTASTTEPCSSIKGLAGLSLVAKDERDVARAKDIFVKLLAGKEEEGGASKQGNELRYSWPGSPMTVSVSWNANTAGRYVVPIERSFAHGVQIRRSAYQGGDESAKKQADEQALLCNEFKRLFGAPLL
ncbi:VOC domain-containing protein [Balamuthia mandrillaris]